MKLNVSLYTLSLAVVFTFCNASFVKHEDSELHGNWVRTTDHLKMRVIEQDPSILYSFITEDGDEKFPCNVKDLPIYKNISRAGKNLWLCDFLVVTVGDCSTHYEEGSIRINKSGEMEINCPGFGRKVYSKITPRYERR